jgi:hypothetical protein
LYFAPGTGFPTRVDIAAATFRLHHSCEVEAAVSALLDLELLSIGFVARDITPLESESAMRSEKRRSECDGRPPWFQHKTHTLLSGFVCR